MHGLKGSAAVLLLVTVTACSAGSRRDYELSGQVVAVDRNRKEITIKHGDIKGFMPGMTMPFTVRDESLLDGKAPGDLVNATLVVEEAQGYLSAITKTGHAPLAEPSPAPAGFDLLETGEAVPDFTFVDAAGSTRRLSDWRGRTVAVTFIYTRCPLPDFCPLMDRHFASVQRQALADPALRDRFHLLSVSFDPVYDTPAVLRAHAERSKSFIRRSPSA